MKRTTLAAKTRLNYLVMMKYINFLKSLSWIVSTDNNGLSDVCITHTGVKFSRLISEYLKNSAQDLPKEWDNTVLKASTAPSGGRVDSYYFDSLTAGEIRETLTEAISTNKIGDDHRVEARAVQQFGLHAQRILLIDDEPDTLLTYKIFLESVGHQVDAFEDPTKAFRHFEREQHRLRYDVVMTDIRMPKVNGLQLYQKLRKIDENVKFVFLTAMDAVEELVSVLPDIEPFQIIRKPVHQDQLLANLDRILVLKS